MPDTADAGRIMAQAVQDGFISPSNRAMLSARLGPEGNAAFDGWLQERGITTQEQPTMDETEYEDDTDEAALPSFGAGGADQFAVMYQQGMSALQRATAAEADARRQAFENAQRHIEQNSFGAPSRSEQLMRISQALLSRRDSRGIAGTLGNLVPALAQSQTDTREAGEQRAAALAQLQQQYATGTASAATAGARSNLDALQALAPNYRPQAVGQPVWSENLQRFMPRDRPVVVETGSTPEGRTERYSDGTIRLYASDGTSALYDAGGNMITEGEQ